jgi:hypothetical protein
MTTLRVLALRPYGDRIRSRVFATLRALDARVSTLVEARATDDEALAALRDVEADALVIPFHAHQDRQGTLVHGLRLIGRIRRELPTHAATPILCPISNVGLAAAGLMAARLEEPVLEGVLLVHEDELGEAALLHLIRSFLRELGADPGSSVRRL